MKTLPSLPRSRRSRTTAAERQRLLAEFERSGLSAVQFARQRGIPYTTFIQWRTKARSRGEVPVTFTEVEMILHVAAKPLVVELGPLARLQLTSPDQLELAAGLLKHLHASC